MVKSILYGNTENWTRLVNECLKKLNEPVPEDLSFSRKKKNKKLKHRNSTNYYIRRVYSSKDINM